MAANVSLTQRHTHLCASSLWVGTIF